MSTDRSDFTQGSILKKLSLFMLPVLGALILQAAYGAHLQILHQQLPVQINNLKEQTSFHPQ